MDASDTVTIPVTERTIDEIVDHLCRAAADLAAAEYVWLTDLAEFDRRSGWSGSGCRDTAEWLSWMVGLDRRAAREKVRVARALETLPAIGAAMASGQLSYSKVRALTRIALPENEEQLVQIGLYGTSNHVERVVSAYRRQAGAGVAAERIAHERRGVWLERSEGGDRLTVQLPTEAMNTLVSALQAIAEQQSAAGWADALVEIAEQAVAATPEQTNGQPKYLGIVHVDVDGLAEADDDRGRCHLETPHGERAVSPDTARRLLCDAALVRATHAPDGSCNLGRRSRVVRGRLKRSLQLRDRTCRFPGCHRRGWLDAHHVVHWTKGGGTDDHNVALLCHFHHRLVHEGGWHIEGDANRELRFIDPHGRSVSSSPPRFLGSAAAVQAFGRSAADGQCRWDGTPLDLHAALDGAIVGLPSG